MKIDGRQIAAKMYADLSVRVGELQKNKGITPHLAVILVGDNPSSLAYIRQKQKGAQQTGAKVSVIKYPQSVSTDDILKKISELNKDENVQGIIVQKPLPKQIDVEKVDESVIPYKDIDGFNTESKYTLALPLGVVEILKYIYHEINKKFSQTEFINWLKTKNIVISGKGPTGGGPTIKYFTNLGIETKVVDSKTRNPSAVFSSADIIIASTGHKNVLHTEDIKNGAILIGVGVYRGEDGRLHGDYEEKEIEHIASYYTPTPGGVGPVNVACLIENLITAAEKQTA